jgi:P4 family phage/plasmid primase-like protien
LRATRFPAFDIDCTDANLAQMIQDAIVGQLGPTPVRTGRAPKRLLMYTLAGEPFSRMRLWIETPAGEKHLVEVLGEGQQYLVHGTHPTSNTPYAWDVDPVAFGVGLCSAAQASACLDFVAQLIEITGAGTCKREGDGRRSTRTAAGDQASLLAPSIELVQECVALIPNADALFPERDDWLRVGYAIRAAVGSEHDEEGFEIFAEFSARWDGGVNDTDYVRDNYRRLTGPYAVGWPFLCELARPYGFNDAALEFEAIEPAPDDVPAVEEAPAYSDQWLAEQLVEQYRGVLRNVPERDAWLVWDNSRWLLDATRGAEDLIRQGLKGIAVPLMRQGASAAEKAKNYKLANVICSAGKVDAVAKLMRSNRTIAVPIAALDHDPLVLNTPAGPVDLVTGMVGAADPDLLLTKQTAVAPAFGVEPVEFMRYLREATGDDAELIGFLQRYVGYCLTGLTREQQFAFVFGPGGSGKGTFLTTVTEILGDYAATADMATFTASHGDRHTTDLAMLVGARLVTASETEAGKRWHEQRIKNVTGGDKITARFMRQDNFTYTPQFKLLIIGNHQPELRDVGRAMRRRLHMVPFEIIPKVTDGRLAEKIRAEYPAILAWMIEGCLAWQRDGLMPPARVLAATEEYFEGEDALGAWLSECCTTGPDLHEETQVLFRSWQEWANPRNEYVGTVKRFSQAMKSRGFHPCRNGENRRRGFEGVRLIIREGDVRLMA